MTIWFTSDLHFNHRNICKYSNRPFSSVKEMNEVLIQNWNRMVRPEDSIWHLGDFAFGPISFTKKILECLNGEINLIYGNHDQEIIKHLDVICNDIKTAQYYKEFTYNKQKFILFHYGMRVWNSSHHGSIMLHGHSHGSLPPHGKSVDVGVDAPFIIPPINEFPLGTIGQENYTTNSIKQKEDYRPVSIDEVIEYMKNKKIEYVDHHNGDR